MPTNDEMAEALEAMLQPIPLTLPADGWHTDEFAAVVGNLRAVSAALLAGTTSIEEKFKTLNLADKAKLLVLLANIKKGLAACATTINKVSPHLEDDACRAIDAQGMVSFQIPGYTLTAKADAYLSKYPKPDQPGWDEFIADPAIAALMKEKISKDDLQALCRQRLEDGQNVPEGCEVYIKASVGIRKRN